MPNDDSTAAKAKTEASPPTDKKPAPEAPKTAKADGATAAIVGVHVNAAGEPLFEVDVAYQCKHNALIEVGGCKWGPTAVPIKKGEHVIKTIRKHPNRGKRTFRDTQDRIEATIATFDGVTYAELGLASPDSELGGKSAFKLSKVRKAGA